MSKKYIVIGCLIALLNISYQVTGHCQKSRIKFGKVELEDLEMKVYPGDSMAPAVILSDIGKFESDDITFTRHLRIKVLSKAGLDWGNWTFDAPSRSAFKVLVFNLENGEVVKTRADNNTIYKEEVVDEYSVYKVFAPGVKVGSIIDIEFSHLGVPREWRFQDIIPIRYNELELEESNYIKYSKTKFGFEPLNQVDDNKWVMENMAAFENEPYINTYKNYITKFEFQLVSLGKPGFRYLEYSSTWSNVINRLLISPYFGDVVNSASFLNDYAKLINGADLPLDEKISRAHQVIKDNIKWNGNYTIYSSSNVRKCFTTDHSGNVADVNLLLVAMLNKVGVRAYPVVLSTRSNGMLVKHKAMASKLNYVVAYVKEGNVEMLLDATSDNLVPGILPERCLNYYGLIINEGSELWVDLNSTYKAKTNDFTMITINEDATGEANISRDHSEYEYYNWVQKRKETGMDDNVYSNELEGTFDDLNIKNIQIARDNNTTLSGVEKLNIDLSERIIDVGDGIIFNPFLMQEFAINPFNSESRKYPVDLRYPRDYTSTIIVKLPENYVPKEIPESTKYTLQGGSAFVTLLTNSTSGTIQFKLNISIQKEVYAENEYPEMRQFFMLVSKLLNQPIELQKI
ncbi:hypothetical protein [Fulvivirga sp.]|uniref:hypothetical protein n=1 Tax=Fulvivirga sp. TaxID=1931237 RepID=UPI0032EB9956